MQITKATSEDIDAILALQTQIYRVEKIAPDASQTLQNQLKDKSCQILIVKEDKKVVATATIYFIDVAARARPYALLEGFVVDEKQRGRGIGRSLLKQFIDSARKKNCYKMIFTSGIDRAEVHNFYKKLGFKKWGVEFRKDL